MKKARYRGIPCLFNPETNEIEGTNWLTSLLIDINVWFDIEIIGVEEFPIYIEDDEG